MEESKYLEEEFIGRWASFSLSEEESKTFDAWLERNAGHKPYFESLRQIHDQALSINVPRRRSPDEIWSRIESEIRPSTNRLFPAWPTRSVKAAAVMVVLLGSYWLLEQRFGVIHLTSESAASARMELPDHSMIVLNAGSSATFNAWRWWFRRELTMQGEAYFEVEKKDEPFVVRSERLTVEVLGTKFNVCDRSDRSEVTCAEGRVRITAQGQDSVNQVILTKGLTVRLMESQTFSRVRQVPPEAVASWVHGRWYYEETALWSVLKDWERYYHMQVRLEGIDSSLTFTGLIESSDIKSALDQLGLAADFSYKSMSDSVFILYKNK